MEAHELLYGEYGKAVYSLALRMLKEPAQADEVLQDTCIEVIRHVGDCREDAAFGGWVKRIAVNKCLALVRSAWQRKALAFDDGDQHEAGSIPEPPGDDDPAARAGHGTDLAWALGELSPTARAVVWLYDVEGYSHQEIAGLMGRTVSFSKSQLSRAHERLRGLLGEDEVTACMPQPSNC
jgi:RNA polymerase sigma-70 factor (ECF subfamily)